MSSKVLPTQCLIMNLMAFFILLGQVYLVIDQFRAGGTGVARVATATPIFWGSFIAATTAATPIFWGCVCCGHPKVLDRAPALDCISADPLSLEDHLISSLSLIFDAWL